MQNKPFHKQSGNTLLTLIMLAVLSAASTASSTSSLSILEKEFSKVERFTLDNGMKVLVKEDHSAPVAAVQIWVGTGAMHEAEYLGAGLSHYIEHMIFKGTPTRTPGDVSREISDVGGDINAYTAHDRTVFYTTLPSARWQVGLDVLADALMQASFPEEEWQREKNVILREMAMGKDSPDRVSSKLLFRTAYQVHPLKVPVIGYEDIFKTMKREDLLTFFKRNYVPDNMITVVVGDVDTAEVLAAIKEVFAGFKRQARPPVVLPEEPAQLSPRFSRETGPFNLSRLDIAYPTVRLSHPDTPALDVLSTIVGDGKSSRLYQKIKEEMKLATDVGAWSFTPKGPGLFGVDATFEPGKEKELIAALTDEIGSWGSKAITEQELEKAKRIILVHELSELQTVRGQAYSIASGEYYAGDPAFSVRYLSQVDALTVDDIQDVAARYLDPEKQTLTILSPSTDDEPGKEKAVEEADIPAVSRVILSNGIPLIVREDHRLPFVYFCAAFKGGLLSETEERNGVMRMMSDCLTRGTATRSSSEIAEAAESLGGQLSPFSGNNSFGLQARFLSDDRETFMDLAADCLLNPAFAEDEVEKQRTLQISAIRQLLEKPFFVAEDALRKQLFPHHPYRWSALGTEETVKAVTRQDIAEAYKTHAVSGNLVLAMFGDISAQDARKISEKLFSGLPEGEAPEYERVESTPELPARIKQREPKQQAIFLMGFPGVDVADPRVDALTALQQALSGLSSELAMEIREKRGLVYYVGAFDRPGLEPGFVSLYAGTTEEAVPELEELMLKEVERLTTDGLTGVELSRAQEQIVGAFQMSLQDNGGLAQQCALNELYGLGYDYVFSLEKRIRDLTIESVRDAAASIMKPDRSVISVVLPGGGSEQTDNQL
ncbi:MAG: insulinase family protein [Verrucomicrobia bacterium]|nr:insulinase family protein [Verrucomicrobiota bacterium]